MNTQGQGRLSPKRITYVDGIRMLEGYTQAEYMALLSQEVKQHYQIENLRREMKVSNKRIRNKRKEGK